MKLKTLKDFSEFRFDYTDEDDPLIHIKELKAEAVKWVKELKEHENNGISDKIGFESYEFTKFYDWQNDTFYQIREWIKHFFNLTEEDLK